MGRTQKNKPHKVRFASKSSRRDHQVAGKPNEIKHKKIGPSQTAKEIRIQRSKNIRDKKRTMLLNERRGIKGDKAAPRILALVPLSAKAETGAFKNRTLAACSADQPASDDGMETTSNGISNVYVSKHKFRLNIIEAAPGDLHACLQLAKVADIVAFVIPATREDDEEYVDQSGKTVLSMLKSQGLPSTIAVILGLEDISAKKRSEIKKLFADCLEAELPPNTKAFNGDNHDDSQQILRHIAEQRPSHVQWRSQRPFVMAEQLSFEPDVQVSNSGTLSLSGYVREQSLSVNQLVHISGLGDFQLGKIDILDDPATLPRGEKMMVVDACKEILPDPNQQEPLIVENVPDTLVGEQTWPTKEELAVAERSAKSLKKRTLPKGTSSYQAAWIVDDHSFEDDNDEEAADTHMECEEEDEPVPLSEDEGTAFDDEGNTSEMMDDESLSISQKEDIKKLNDDLRNDEEFPDEVDTPMDVPARERFARYRGLKSLRTSAWDPKESLPPDYARIFAFDNFNRTMKLAVQKAKQSDAFSVPVGTYVKLHIKNVSSKAAESLLDSYQKCPLVAVGLLQHESKMSVMHFGIKKYDEHSAPIKSKDALVCHTGFRSYIVRPVFSTDDMNMNKHKYERFLHPGRFSVASAYMPVQFPPAPLIVFKAEAGNLQYVASGALKNADPDRIILKKIVLSGYPLRVQKRKAVVRYMFYNSDDIRWFKPLELWTKYGRRGRIMEPVGTHGAMKCVFDGVVQQRDAVCVSLYKRVFPKWSESNI